MILIIVYFSPGLIGQGIKSLEDPIKVIKNQSKKNIMPYFFWNAKKKPHDHFWNLEKLSLLNLIGSNIINKNDRPTFFHSHGCRQ